MASLIDTQSQTKKIIDIAVIGAGLSGLHCVKTILDNAASKNTSNSHSAVDIRVSLIEAQSNVGGRTKAVKLIHNTFVDVGASWIHQPVNNPGTDFVNLYGRRGNSTPVPVKVLSMPFEPNSTVYVASNEQIDFKEYAEYFAEILEEVEQMEAKSLNSISLKAALELIVNKYESMSLEELEDENISVKNIKTMRNLLPIFTECLSIMTGGDAEDLPLKDFEEGGGLNISGGNHIVTSTFGVTVNKFYNDLVSKYSRTLKTYLSHEVKAIQCKSNMNTNTPANSHKNIVVHTLDKENSSEKCFHADVVIVTLPLGVLKKMHTTLFPGGILPSYKVKSIEKLGFGNILKLYLLFTDAFWKDDNESESPNDEATWLMCPSENLGEFQIFLDYSTVTQDPILLAFAGGKNATVLENIDDEKIIIEKAIQSLSKGTGVSIEILRKKLKCITKTGWGQDPYSYGAYSFLHKKSGKLDRKNLQAPISIGNNERNLNNVYFAGEACHSSWAGTVHGAIDSGRNVAFQFLKEYDML